MKINIAGWSSEGLRCPDVDVDLRQDGGESYHVALLQMPNGTGKTTTLEMLKATLSGEGASWDETKVRAMRRKDAKHSTGRFKVRLMVDGKPVTFELELDFVNGRATSLTTRPGSGGLVRGWKPLPEIRRFVESSFLNLFVFNGELANELFLEDKAKAEDAIDSLCQLYLVEDIMDFVEDSFDTAIKNATGPKSSQALLALRRKRDELRVRKAKLQRMRTKAVQDRETAKKASEELQARITAKTSGHEKDKAAHADAKVAEATAKAAVESARDLLLQSLRNPLSFSPAIGAKLVNWKNCLDELKLPEATSAQFFNDLKKRTECICGTPMTDVMREQISNEARLVLSSEETGAMNFIKSEIEHYQPKAGEPSLNDVMLDRLAALSTARRDHLKASQDVRTYWRKIVDAGGEEVKEWEKQQKAHDAKCGECEDLIRDIDDPGLNVRTGEIFSLARIQREIDDASKKIADATGTEMLRAKTAAVTKIIRRAEELARRAIKTELVDSCNRRLRQILADDPIALESIDGHLVLAGQERGSEAQTLSVGYTFLMTLLERGDNRFPLLVDSPVGKMDGTVRRAVGELVPTLCSQFVTFVINTERPYFVPALKRAARDVLHLTFFRQTPGTQRLMAGLPKTGVTRTADGILVEDEAYFEAFDMEVEGR
ncbi:AAA family ATPase [Sphingosinicella terrae]|uniref:AAA family ATPase n=1 Tax=Sphingosinicella terrae TaxID=2172047 RepID=UPI000E0D1817|nr:AAA family ATPase [Sphingosinicella terrae]